MSSPADFQKHEKSQNICLKTPVKASCIFNANFNDFCLHFGFQNLLRIEEIFRFDECNHRVRQVAVQVLTNLFCGITLHHARGEEKKNVLINKRSAFGCSCCCCSMEKESPPTREKEKEKERGVERHHSHDVFW